MTFKGKLFYAFCSLILIIAALVLINTYFSSPKNVIVFRSNSYIFKFRLNDYGFLDIPVTIKGKKIYMTIDTGASRSLMQNYIPGTKNDRISQITDHKGSTFAENNVTIDTMSFGAFDITGHSFVQGNSKTGFSDGIIGMDILQYFTMKVNFRNQEVELTRGSSVNSLAHLQRIPIIGAKNAPCIEIGIDGVRTTFLMDTGYNMFASINLSTAGTALKKDLVHWQGYDDNITYRQSPEPVKVVKHAHKIVNVSVLNRRLDNEIIEFYDRKNLMHLVGMDFFKRFETVIFDFPNTALYVGKTNRKSFSYFRSSFLINGIGIVFNNDSLPIITQKSEWINNKYLNVGDTIVKFGNTLLVKNIASKALRPIRSVYKHGGSGAYSEFEKLVRRARFSESDGQIGILKNGTLLPITLKRKKLLKSQDEYWDYYAPMDILNIPYMTAQRVTNDTSDYYVFKEIPGM